MFPAFAFRALESALARVGSAFVSLAFSGPAREAFSPQPASVSPSRPTAEPRL